MKLLYLMTEPFGYGGVQSDLLALSEDLSAREHEVLVATSEGELLEELKSKGATFIDIDFNFSTPIRFFKSAIALREAIKDNDVEVLAPQSVRSTLVSYFALRLMPFMYRVKGTGKRCPIVTTIHNIHNPVHFKYAGFILNRCSDFVIFESHYERDRCMASGLPGTKSEVVHSGIDTDKFAPVEVDQDLLKTYGIDKSVNKVFGIVARLSEEKGHDHLINAFKIVLKTEPDARLMIIGDGPLKEPLLKQQTELGLEKQVIFTGAQRNIPAYLSIFDVFVLSSTRESFPLAAREAMAAGRPVVAPRIGGCPEVVDDGNTGFLFESANEDDLCQQMLNILVDEKYKQFGERSRQRVVDLFSRKQWIVGDERIYQEFNKAS